MADKRSRSEEKVGDPHCPQGPLRLVEGAKDPSHTSPSPFLHGLWMAVEPGSDARPWGQGTAYGKQQ